MADRAYLTEAMPLCVIWGEDDRVIPANHASIASELAPGARVEMIANAGHFPHKDHPERFVRIVNDFVRKTQPATYSRARFRSLLKNGRVPAGATEQPVEIACSHADPPRLTVALVEERKARHGRQSTSATDASDRGVSRRGAGAPDLDQPERARRRRLPA